MNYTITPLTPHTGAEVRGIDLNRPVDDDARAALNRAFARHHVLVIRDQQFTPPQFIAAAQIFGELFQHDKREMHVPGYPQIYYVSNEQTVPGKRYISGETFHTDHSNHPAPP
ncbi:MAG TPA: TauD/TfdA family dioxygenase, partial [Stellaceae bacterium]